MTAPTTGTDWLARVRALLAKAESTEHAAEAETYNAKARDLIARHGIDEALAFAAGRTRDSIERRVLYTEAPYALDKVGLLNAVYDPLNCRTVRHGGKYRDGRIKVTVVGYSADLDRAELLYTSLLLQAVHGAAREVGTRGHASRTAADRRAWLAGFASAVRGRLTVAEREARDAATGEADGPSTAVVLADRTTAVERDLAAAFPNLRQSYRSLSGSGYGAGHAAGQRADIGGKRVGGARAALRA